MYVTLPIALLVANASFTDQVPLSLVGVDSNDKIKTTHIYVLSGQGSVLFWMSDP